MSHSMCCSSYVFIGTKKTPDGYKIKKLNILTEPAEEQLCAACEQSFSVCSCTL